MESSKILFLYTVFFCNFLFGISKWEAPDARQHYGGVSLLTSHNSYTSKVTDTIMPSDIGLSNAIRSWVEALCSTRILIKRPVRFFYVTLMSALQNHLCLTSHT